MMYFEDFNLIEWLVKEYKAATNRTALALKDAETKGLKKPRNDKEFQKKFAAELTFKECLEKALVAERCRNAPGELVPHDYFLVEQFLKAIEVMGIDELDTIVKEFTEPRLEEEVTPEIHIPEKRELVKHWGPKTDD